MDDKTLHMLNGWATQLQHALVNAAPKVWDVLVQVKRVDCIGNLTGTVVGCVVLLIVAAKLWQNCRTYWKRTETDYDDALKVVAVFSGLGAVGCGGFSLGAFLFTVLNQWVWIGVFYPQLAVAHDIISKVTGQ